MTGYNISLSPPSADLSLADTLSEAAVVSSVLGAVSLGVSRYWAGAYFYIICKHYIGARKTRYLKPN